MVSEDLRELLGRKRTIEVLQLLSDRGTLNYSEVENAIETSSDTISNSLSLLREYGVIERDEQSPKNVQYRITQKGAELLDALERVESVLSQES